MKDLIKKLPVVFVTTIIFLSLVLGMSIAETKEPVLNDKKYEEPVQKKAVFSEKKELSQKECDVYMNFMAPPEGAVRMPSSWIISAIFLGASVGTILTFILGYGTIKKYFVWELRKH